MLSDQEYDSGTTSQSEWSADDDSECATCQESNDITWFNEACRPERKFKFDAVYEQIDPNLPRVLRPRLIGYEIFIDVEKNWPAIMNGDVRLAPTIHHHYLEKPDLDFPKEVVRIMTEYTEDKVLKLPLKGELG